MSGVKTTKGKKRAARIVADRPSRWRLLLRRRHQWGMPVLLGTCAIAVLIVIGIVRHEAAASIAGSRERFARIVNLPVQDIVIAGRQNTPEPLLRAALGVMRGDPMLGVAVEAARKRIETLSWVGHASVERRFPGTIFVDLHEKRPFAIWQNQGKFQLVDRDGAVVTNEDVGAFSTLPLVVGGPSAPTHASALFDLLDRYPGLRSRVAAAIRVGDRRWNVKLSTGTEIMLPEGAEAPAIARLSELEASQSLLERSLAVVDMRLPDRLVVRPQTDLRPAQPTPERPT